MGPFRQARSEKSERTALTSEFVGIVVWLIVVVVVLLVAAFGFVIARRKSRAGGVIATREKRFRGK
jgi:nitrate reductase NapE component